MKKSILALASGTFALGAAEFVMMGVLPRAADETAVSIPTAGHYVSAYAIGVCVGALFLIFGRKIKPRNLIVLFMVITLVGNLLAALAPNFAVLVLARFISGLPHGAYFGTATIMAKVLADKGKEGIAVSQMVLGQTVANMIGVPVGTWLGSTLSWRLAFAILSAWAVMTIILVIAWVPDVSAIKDAGLMGQFKFLKRIKPWFVILAVFFGNSGIFCWWSYVSPWLQKTGGWSEAAVPLLMTLAGFGMVVGGLAGGKITDKFVPGAVAGFGQLIAVFALIAIFLDPGSRPTSALLTFICAVGMFFISSPQQLLMVQLGEGGGEMLAGAMVQIAFNGGNSVGSLMGGWALDNSQEDYHMSALTGVPFTLLAVILLFAFYFLYERKKRNQDIL
ncbi:MFS transporter [Alloscardovia criceti]|uniref:MFS transporter n=1 Tax=Alloscardovia criceti TaxID=356828 RepID=UPI00036B63B7|nr:MFS transporter [Alloscardovia criceti]